ncbi:MAG TPA: YggS family pyridoxal phosphate-dependent enzyme [Pirellulales bacterium]|nr:YggS family pyridoxal phosphate-dependent enzyme [Pirellulales bacterium]
MLDPERRRRLAENLARVREQIGAAAQAGGRAAEEVRLVAATKYAPLADVEALVAAGCLDLAESRPQDFWERVAALHDPRIRWHFIGHLQRNKIERTIPHVQLLHSGDSVRLLQAIDQAAAALHAPLRLLLEVKISADPAKHGFTADELEAALPQLAELKRIQICGLMGMASRAGGSVQARRDFAQLRGCRDRLRAAAPELSDWKELSMGMSGDFVEAVAEGATLVRIGSALFEGLDRDISP